MKYSLSFFAILLVFLGVIFSFSSLGTYSLLSLQAANSGEQQTTNEDPVPTALPQMSVPVSSPPPAPPVAIINPAKAEAQTGSFLYRFSESGVLEESGSLLATRSPFWWLGSGGQLIIKDGVGRTIQGDLPTDNKWYKAYKRTNPQDSDGGLHPQNVFRLVLKSKWQNMRQEVYFRIVKDNLSTSPLRYVSNGLLLLNRYQDSANLYYAGIRVDGLAVIKKKYRGAYYVMASKKIFSGSYDREKNPSLLPKNQWLGVRTEVINRPDQSVVVALYIDKNRQGVWEKVLEVVDAGIASSGKPFFESGFGGIRTDFMDVEFDDYMITKL